MTMVKRANSRVTVQCDKKTHVQALRACLLDRFGDTLVFDTEVRPNSRELYPDGKHTILHFLLAKREDDE